MTAFDSDTVLPDGIIGMSFTEPVPEVGNPTPVGFSEYLCEVCSAPVPLTETGRRPKVKRCNEHKTVRGSVAGRNTGSNTALIERAIMQLESAYTMVGAAAKFVDGADTGEMIQEHAKDLAESWRAMLTVNKAFRDAFAKLEKGSAWLPVVVAHGDLISTVMIERRLRALEKHANSTFTPGAPSDNPIDGFGV